LFLYNKKIVLKIANHPIYAHPLPEGHRFPMLKYELIPEQLLHEGTITNAEMFEPEVCLDETILLTHCPIYLEKLNNQTLSASEQRKIGFPQSKILTLREKIITQGTIDCCKYAFEEGVALNIAGGTHHAFFDRGEGFCLLNDFAVAANFLLQKNIVKKLLLLILTFIKEMELPHCLVKIIMFLPLVCTELTITRFIKNIQIWIFLCQMVF